MVVGGSREGGETPPPTLNPTPQTPHPFQVRTNVPSWCDRILWKSYPETHVNCNAYGERCPPTSPGHRVSPRPPRTPYVCVSVPPPSILTPPNPAGCTDDIVTSDHSPVFGSFEVGVTSQFVSKKGAGAQGDTPRGPTSPCQEGGGGGRGVGVSRGGGP